MKKRILNTIVALALNSVLFAQNTENKALSEFKHLRINGQANIVLIQGKENSLRCENNDKLVIEQEGDMLSINDNSGSNSRKIYLTFTRLESIQASGSCKISSDSTLNLDKLYLSLTGASSLKLGILSKELRTNASGASIVNLSGATEKHKIEISGASSLKAYKLSTVESDIETSGASSARINVNQKLNAMASGASSIKYIGSPSDKVTEATSGSSVKQVTLDESNVTLNDIDTTKIQWGKKKYIIIDDGHENDDDSFENYFDNFRYWAGLELKMNGYLSAENSLTLPEKYQYMDLNYSGKSMSVNLNLFQKNFHIYKDYVNIVTGLGFGFNAYQFRNKTRLNADSSFTWYGTDNLIEFDKNKLKSSFVHMPLLLEFNTSSNSHRSFHIAAGVIGGYKLSSKTKREYTLNGYEVKEKRKDDYNLNPFRLDATARIGYGDFTLFATYSLTSLFEAGKGPELYPFSVGIRLVPF